MKDCLANSRSKLWLILEITSTIAEVLESIQTDLIDLPISSECNVVGSELIHHLNPVGTQSIISTVFFVFKEDRDKHTSW
mmetsp:Transcript_22320/g.19823  ORF Transcript_22320/g.19823 Transcript_22320/m.19823 type:complete len:80 (-) Transcript_22320:966-1205(-)